MDATNPSPTRPNVNPEQERRQRARVMMHAALAAMDAYERAVRADFDHARGLIAQVEGWLGGGGEPELFETWRTVHRDLFSVADTQTSTAQAASGVYEAEFTGNLPFTDAAVSGVLSAAAGTEREPLADSVRVLRGELISQARGDGAEDFADEVAELFDAACARMPSLPEDCRKHLETIEVAP